ncbi:hypothetical protein [Celerinatantimonas yamalensis]|uniref:Uncharacterized protein n=1 Tax=Celerinatantimonas yamalensis TaxID=559956 RepID=A0ABW9G5G8_9GAMM
MRLGTKNSYLQKDPSQEVSLTRAWQFFYPSYGLTHRSTAAIIPVYNIMRIAHKTVQALLRLARLGHQSRIFVSMRLSGQWEGIA